MSQSSFTPEGQIPVRVKKDAEVDMEECTHPTPTKPKVLIWMALVKPLTPLSSDTRSLGTQIAEDLDFIRRQRYADSSLTTTVWAIGQIEPSLIYIYLSTIYLHSNLASSIFPQATLIEIKDYLNFQYGPDRAFKDRKPIATSEISTEEVMYLDEWIKKPYLWKYDKHSKGSSEWLEQLKSIWQGFTLAYQQYTVRCLKACEEENTVGDRFKPNLGSEKWDKVFINKFWYAKHRRDINLAEKKRLEERAKEKAKRNFEDAATTTEQAKKKVKRKVEDTATTRGY